MKLALSALRIALPALLIMAAAPRAVRAQQIVRLLEFTNVWKFNDSGADLGTAWREPAYDDSAWPSGPGLFGVESNLPPPYPIAIQTPMSLGSGSNITFYLRTHFQYAGGLTTTGTVVRARIFADDGCLVYLNGVAVGRIRLQPDPDYLTFATPQAGGSNPEGVLDWFELSPDLLLHGDNVLAVEVHQAYVGSSDIVFGMRLDAMVPEPLVITEHPADQTITIPFPGTGVATPAAFFRADVAGGPANYQWWKDGTNLLNAQTAYLNIAVPSLADVGEYSVVVSNALGVVTSDKARLTVVAEVPPGTGLKLIRASGHALGNEPNRRTNTIDLYVTKPLNFPSATAVQNYSVQAFGSGNLLPIASAQYNNPIVRLTLVSALQYGESYYVTVNNVRDTSGNTIAPNSQIGVSWTIVTNIVAPGDIWHYHAFATQDISIHDAKWWEPSYVESEYWQLGSGGFDTRVNMSNCVGLAHTTVPYQKQAMLYRIPFMWPSHLKDVLDVRLEVAANPLPVVWLNGEEIYRYPISSSFPQWPTPVDVNTRTYDGNYQSCNPGMLIPSAKFSSGTNWLVTGVFQIADSAPQFESTGPSWFNASLEVTYLQTGAVPNSPPPQLMALQIAPGQYQLWWTGGGYALETATNIVTVRTNTVVGPWLEVPDMANPYIVTVNPDEPLRLFRLRK